MLALAELVSKGRGARGRDELAARGFWVRLPKAGYLVLIVVYLSALCVIFALVDEFVLPVLLGQGAGRRRKRIRDFVVARVVVGAD